MPKNLLVEDIKPTGILVEDTKSISFSAEEAKPQSSVEDIKSKMVDLGNVSAFVWRGGTTTYRNHSLYRSHDLYRGGKSSSSDAGESSIKPKILSIEDL